MVKLFEGAMREKKYVIKSMALALGFWLIQFIYWFYAGDKGNTQTSIIRASSITGTILIGLALLTGPLARLSPKYNYIVHRRTLGVLGFTFGIVHAVAVVAYVFGYNFMASLFTLNPFVNPIVFGVLAFVCYVPLYLTSTDWALQKIKYKWWKTIHRLVYFAYISTVLHFTQINPAALNNVFGYALLAITVLVFTTELAAFLQHTKARPGLGRYIGILIILFAAALFYYAYTLNKTDIVLYGAIIVIVGGSMLFFYVTKGIAKVNTTQAV